MSNKVITTITAGKLLKKDTVVEVQYTKKIEGKNKPATGSEEYKIVPHPDLVQAFAGLNIHAALIGEFVPISSVPDIKQPDESICERYHVSGFSINGIEKDDEGVILTAQKTLSRGGKVLGFNTPTIKFNDTNENAYPYIDELMKAVEVTVKEMELYLGGKYSPDPQGKLDLETEEK